MQEAGDDFLPVACLFAFVLGTCDNVRRTGNPELQVEVLYGLRYLRKSCQRRRGFARPIKINLGGSGVSKQLIGLLFLEQEESGAATSKHDQQQVKQ